MRFQNYLTKDQPLQIVLECKSLSYNNGHPKQLKCTGFVIDVEEGTSLEKFQCVLFYETKYDNGDIIYRMNISRSYYRSYVDNYEYCSTTSTTTLSSTSVSTVTTSSSSSSTSTSTTPTTYLTESSSTTSTSSKTERNTCSNDIDIDFGAITPNGDTTKATIEECYPYILMHINESKSYSVYNPEFQPCTDSMYFDCSNPGIAYNQYLVCQNSLRLGFYEEESTRIILHALRQTGTGIEKATNLKSTWLL